MGVCHSRRPGCPPKPALDVHVVPAPGTAEAPEALEPGLKEEAAGGASPKRPTFFNGKCTWMSMEVIVTIVGKLSYFAYLGDEINLLIFGL